MFCVYCLQLRICKGSWSLRICTCMQVIYLSRNRICRLDTTKCSRCTSLDLLEVQFTALSGVTFVSVFAISRLSTNLSSPLSTCSFTAVSGVGLGRSLFSCSGSFLECAYVSLSAEHFLYIDPSACDVSYYF